MINEISLLSPLTFTLLDKVARYIRKCDKPFGGVKVIAAGDFLEHTPALPSLSTPECGTAGNLFCFQTPSWNDFGFQGNTFLLNPVENMNTLYSAEEGVSSTSNSLGFVCKYEATYRQILDAIHNGRLTMDMLNLLNTCDVKYKKRPDESISNSNEDLEVLPMKLCKWYESNNYCACAILILLNLKNIMYGGVMVMRIWRTVSSGHKATLCVRTD